MHISHHMPYVGIPASAMIAKLQLDFINTADHLTCIDTCTGEHHDANAYEKKLFLQSQMEKFMHTGGQHAQ